MTIHTLISRIEKLEIENKIIRKEMEVFQEEIFILKGKNAEREIKTQKARSVLEHLCKMYGFSVNKIVGLGRQRELVNERFIIANELHDMGYSNALIGRLMNRDHTSIAHLLNRGIKE